MVFVVHNLIGGALTLKRTKMNLIMAVQCGALDAAKYQRFAACASMDGDWEIAKAFQDAADTNRRQRFGREAELERPIADSPDNLCSAIAAETRDANMFAEFAREAMEDGDHNAAALFDRVRSDKAQSCRRFQAILESMGIQGNKSESFT